MIMLDDLIPKFDVMRKCLNFNIKPKISKRCESDLNGCSFFKTKGVKNLSICMGDGHYRCKECVNLTETISYS